MYAIADGEIIAWRLNDTLPEYEPTPGKKYSFSTGFVLIRHTFENNKVAGNTDTTNTLRWTYYSLYMHVLHKPELAKKKRLPLFLVTQRKALAPLAKTYDAVTVLKPATGHAYSFCKIKHMGSGQEGWVPSAAVDVTKKRLLFPLEYLYATDPVNGLDPAIKLDTVVSCAIPVNANEIIGYGGSIAHQGSIPDIFHLEVFTDETTLQEFFSNPTADVLGWAFLQQQTDLFDKPTSDITRRNKSFLPTHKLYSVTPVDRNGKTENALDSYCFRDGATGGTPYYSANTVKFTSCADWEKRGWTALQETGEFSQDGFCDQTSKLFTLLDTNRDQTLEAAELRDAKQLLRKLAVKHPTEWSSAANETKYAALKTGAQELPKLDADSHKKFIDHVKQQQFWESVPGLPSPNAVWHLHPIGFVEHLRVAQCTLTGVPEEDFIKQVQETLRLTVDLLEKRKRQMAAWDDTTQASFFTWFGVPTPATRAKITDRIDKMLVLVKTRQHKDILRAGFDQSKAAGYGGVFAYVWRNDPAHRIFLGSDYHRAIDTGTDSRVGVLIHEMSHFSDVGDTRDHKYSQEKCLDLVLEDTAEGTAKALENADSFEYFMEDGFFEK